MRSRLIPTALVPGYVIIAMAEGFTHLSLAFIKDPLREKMCPPDVSGFRLYD